MIRFNISTFILIVLLLSTGCSSQATADPSTPTDSCYAALENNILTIGNDRIQRKFEFNKGELKSISLLDVTTGGELITKHRRPDIRIGKLTGKPRSVEWTKKIVEDSVTPRHLQVEVTTAYEKIDVKRVFRVYKDCAVIGCDYYIRGKSENTPNFTAAETILQMLRPLGKHWNYRAVEFFDRTDALNTMVRETSTLAFVHGAKLGGNVLYAQNPLREDAFFIGGMGIFS